MNEIVNALCSYRMLFAYLIFQSNKPLCPSMSLHRDMALKHRDLALEYVSLAMT